MPLCGPIAALLRGATVPAAAASARTTITATTIATTKTKAVSVTTTTRTTTTRTTTTTTTETTAQTTAATTTTTTATRTRAIPAISANVNLKALPSFGSCYGNRCSIHGNNNHFSKASSITSSDNSVKITDRCNCKLISAHRSVRGQIDKYWLLVVLLLVSEMCCCLGITGLSSAAASLPSSSSSSSSSSPPPSSAAFSSPYLPPHWPTWRPSLRSVRVAQGSLRGRVLSVRSSVNARLREVEVFLGVPYAAPPVGRLRFRPPQSPPSWYGERDLARMPPSCVQAFPNISGSEEELSARMSTARLNYLRRLQPYSNGSRQNEDCLYLNVFVPATPRAAEGRQLPVLVVLSAGDSYSWGNGNHIDGSLTAAYSNVIVVSINYRLGVLGFLASGSPSSASNVGMHDQLAALAWLRANIAAFGGDQDKVTLAGAGRAAAFAHLLGINPRTADLFRRLVLVGGSALSSWAVCADGAEQALRLAQALGCDRPPTGPGAAEEKAGPGTNSLISSSHRQQASSRVESLVECLRERSADELVTAAQNLLVPDYLCGPFGPTPDGDLVPVDVYEATLGQGRHTRFAHLDIIIGVTGWESLQLFNDYQRVHGIEPGFKERTLRTLVRNLYVYHQNEILFSVSNEYTNWSRGEPSTLDVLQDTANALSDSTVVAPAVELATVHSHLTAIGKSQRSTHLFVYAYQSASCDYSHLYSCTPSAEDAFSVLLGMPLIEAAPGAGFSYSRQDAQVSELMLNYINNFLRTGQPNSSTIETVVQQRTSRPVTEEISWPLFDSKNGMYLLVDAKPRSLQHFEAHRMSLWNRLIPALHRPDSPVDVNSSPAAATTTTTTTATATTTDVPSLVIGDHSLLESSSFSTRYSQSTKAANSSSSRGSGFGQAAAAGSFPRIGSSSFSQGPFVFRLPLLVTLQSTAQTQPAQPGQNGLDPMLGSVPSAAAAALPAATGAASPQGRPPASPSSPPPPPPPASGLPSGAAALDQLTLSLESLASGPYSKALFITIAVGCSLLVVNLLVFAGTYYQHRTDAATVGSDSDHEKTAPSVTQRHRIANIDSKKSTNYETRESPIMFHLSLSEKSSLKSSRGEMTLGALDLYGLGQSDNDRHLLTDLNSVTTSPQPQDRESGPEGEQLMRPLLESFHIRPTEVVEPEVSEDLSAIRATGLYKEPEYQNIVVDTNQSLNALSQDTSGETTV